MTPIDTDVAAEDATAEPEAADHDAAAMAVAALAARAKRRPARPHDRYPIEDAGQDRWAARSLPTRPEPDAELAAYEQDRTAALTGARRPRRPPLELAIEPTRRVGLLTDVVQSGIAAAGTAAAAELNRKRLNPSLAAEAAPAAPEPEPVRPPSRSPRGSGANR